MQDLERETRKTTNEHARDAAFRMLEFSQCKISGVAVGASVVALHPKSISYEPLIFRGCNIEIATSKVIHAEEVALYKAISDGFTNIESCHVTSNNEAQRAALCGYCRQTFLYINPDTMLYVYNPDKSLKVSVKLIDTMNYPYMGTGRIG